MIPIFRFEKFDSRSGAPKATAFGGRRRH